MISWFFIGMNYFRQRAKQVIKEKISFDPIHLMGTFFNCKTRKMKHLSPKEREECFEHVKQEMLLLDVNDHVASPATKRPITTTDSTLSSYMTAFYMNEEYDDDENSGTNSSSKAAAHLIEIDMYLKYGVDQTTTVEPGDENAEYNPLSFWKKKHTSYPVLAKVAARILAVPATSAAVEREFSFTGNIITQKRARLSPDTVNDIVFNHSYNLYKKNLVMLNNTCNFVFTF